MVQQIYKRFNRSILESHETQFEIQEFKSLYEVFEGSFTEISLLYRTFLERTETQLQEIESSIKTGDKEIFGRIFHDIHGASSNIGLRLITTTLKDMKRDLYKENPDGAIGHLKLLKIALEDLNDWLSKLQERMQP